MREERNSSTFTSDTFHRSDIVGVESRGLWDWMTGPLRGVLYVFFRKEVHRGDDPPD